MSDCLYPISPKSCCISVAGNLYISSFDGTDPSPSRTVGNVPPAASACACACACACAYACSAAAAARLAATSAAWRCASAASAASFA